MVESRVKQDLAEVPEPEPIGAFAPLPGVLVLGMLRSVEGRIEEVFHVVGENPEDMLIGGNIARASET